MQISHHNLANIFSSPIKIFFCPDLFYHVIKQERETGKCNMRQNDHLKIAWVNVFTESTQHSIFSTVENYANLLTKPHYLWFSSVRALIAQIFYFVLLKTKT